MNGDFLRWLMDKMKSFVCACVCMQQQNVLLHLTELRRGNNGVSDIRQKKEMRKDTDTQKGE